MKNRAKEIGNNASNDGSQNDFTEVSPDHNDDGPNSLNPLSEHAQESVLI